MKDYIQYVYENYLQKHIQNIKFTKQHANYLLLLLTLIIGLSYYLPLFFIPIFLNAVEITLAIIIAIIIIVFFGFLTLFIYKTVIDYRESLYSSGDNKYEDDDESEDD